MIMLGFMETEKEFIKNWEKYRGAAGCLRYLAYWFLFGIIVIPLMLTAINPDGFLFVKSVILIKNNYF